LIETTNSHIVLLTAAHVVTNDDGSINTNLFFRLNPSNTNQAILVHHSENLNLLGGWFLSTEADLACRVVQFYQGYDFKTLPVAAFLPLTNLQVSAPVLVLGFPLGLRSETYASPIARRGIVAHKENKSVLLDAFVFPGNSGGPVVYTPLLRFGGGSNINITSLLSG